MPPSQACVGLDGRLDRIVLKALQHDKVKRYRSVDDFATVIRTYLESPAPKFRWAARPLLVRTLAVLVVLYALGVTYLAVKFSREAMRRPPIFTIEPEWPDRPASTSRIPPPEYYARTENDEPSFKFTFDEVYWPGLNPPLLAFDPYDSFAIRQPDKTRPVWEHFEGPNRPGSEGWSNLYVTRRWYRSPMYSLRSKTGIARSGRVNSLNIRKYVEPEPNNRMYYQLWIHLLGKEHDFFECGFVTINPTIFEQERVSHMFTNAVRFERDGAAYWMANPTERRVGIKISDWPQGQEFVCRLRVEMEFAKGRAQVWIDGQQHGVDLPLTPKRYYDDRAPDHTFRLNRWGFLGPTNYDQKSLGGHPDLMFQPGYADIDDLELGTWEYTGSDQSEPAEAVGSAP